MRQDVEAQLKRFLEAQISIPMAARSDAARSQRYLRDVLRGKSTTDSGFPFVLEDKDSDFLGGSFERHTAIWPLDDIDLYVPLDGAGLAYNTNGQQLPFEVVSDSSLRKPSRLLSTRWSDGWTLSSRLLLRGLLAALRESYPRSGISSHDKAVVLDTTVAATSESNGITFDVVPCFRLQPHDASPYFYLMPDGQDGWLRTNPRIDSYLSDSLQEYHNKNYRKCVRLLKYWNVNRCNHAFPSYYIELATCLQFSALKDNDIRVDSVVDALEYAFAALQTTTTTGAIQSLVPDAAPVEGPAQNQWLTSRLGAACISARLAAMSSWESNADAAKAHLAEILGTDFFDA
jgi:hypothetical protein